MGILNKIPIHFFMVLVTGYKGFIGQKLCNALEEDYKGIDIKDGMNLLTCELPENIDIIYHLAAQSSVESSWHDPLNDLDNLRITARLAHHYPYAKIIYANSAAAINPASPYGFSKKVSGDYLKTFHSNSVICFFPNVYGGTKSVVDIFKGKDDVVVYGTGEQLRDYVHIDDIVKGLLKAKDWKAGEYFMGSTIATSVLELAEGKNVTFMPARKEAFESVLPNTTPNWEPTIKVKEYLSTS